MMPRAMLAGHWVQSAPGRGYNQYTGSDSRSSRADEMCDDVPFQTDIGYSQLRAAVTITKRTQTVALALCSMQFTMHATSMRYRLVCLPLALARVPLFTPTHLSFNILRVQYRNHNVISSLKLI
jgi:hypothetical protein